ncbi:MAG: hypothetical protein H7067_18170 [Burkholderiales bacterium]|nr:hypothetical protein [Opitutaceae bacterium]
MKITSTPALLRVALLAAFLPLSAFAQKAPVPPAEKPEAQAPARPAERFSLKFPGGTLADFATFLGTDAVAKQGVFNLLVQPEAATLPLPAFEVRNADAPTLAAALSRLLAHHPEAYLEEATNYLGHGTSGASANLTSASWIYVAGIYRLKPEAAAEAAPVTHPFVVAELIKPTGPFEIVDIIGAIRAAWELDPTKAATTTTSLNLKYHEASRLLLAAGPREAVNLAGQVIGEMGATAKILRAQK